MKLLLRDKNAPENKLKGSKQKFKTKTQPRTRASAEAKTVTDEVKNSPETRKNSVLKNKWLYVGLLLGVIVLCVSTIGLVFGLHSAKSSEKTSNVNIEMVSNITEKNRPSPKKVIKNGKEYFVMSKKQAS